MKNRMIRLPITLVLLAILVSSVPGSVVAQERESVLGQSVMAPRFLTYPFPCHTDMHVQLGWHSGIDYIKGVPNNKHTWTSFDVLAAADGEACKFWHEGGQWNVGGWYVRIAHTHGGINFTTEYNHLDSAESFIPLCNNSTHVTRGQKVGVAGDKNLANCQPPCKHLHFELRANSTIPNPGGTKVDPYDIWNINAAFYPDPNSGSSGCMGDHYWTTDPPSCPGTATPPTANAGGPYAANEGETVILDASGSSDPDGMIASFEWDLDGDGEYDDATGQTSSWTWGDDYVGNIGLKVTDDDGATGTDTTTVTISNVAPTVDAGPDQTAFRNDFIALSGAWTDPAGSLDELYSWTWDVTGDGIMDNSGSASYGSIVPASTSFATEGVYTLTFAVTDKDGGVGSDSIMVEVLNRPPDCSVAAPSIETIWPPNHKFVPVNVLGVADPEGDPVSITINSIRQDEPVDTVGNGRFSPDGQGIGTDTAHVRAERIGTKKAPGNGRVYHIGFTADDGHGGSCSSKVLVGVPHDRKDTPPVNDGALYNSTALAP